MNRERITVTIRGGLLKQIDRMIDGENIRNRSHAIEKALIEKFGELLVEQAIILGGGKGITLQEGKTISPLLYPVDGKPLIERHIEQLKNFGVEEVMLSVGTFGEQIREVIGDGSRFDIKVVYFERDLGTAGVLRQAKSLLKATFLMINGHNIFESLDIEDLLAFHKNNRAVCTMSVVPVADPVGFGQVQMRGSHVVKFLDKSDEAVSHLINAGIYVIDPSVCEMVTPETRSFEKEMLPFLVKNGDLSGYVLDRSWKRIENYGK